MTREEARVLLKNLNNQLTSAFYDGDFWVEEGTFEAFEVADAALRGPQPDPITGLVPCGCGGVAEELFDGFSFDGDGMECNDYLVKCKKCGMQTQVIQTWNEKARDIWNTAMGWKGGAE